MMDNNGEKTNKNLTGIRGWLILPAVGIVVSLIMLPVGLVQKLAFIGTSRHIGLQDKFAGVSAYLAFDIMAGFLVLAFLAAVAWLFFTKKEILPRMIIRYLYLSAGLAIVKFVLANIVYEVSDVLVLVQLLRHTGVISLTISCIIWRLYFLKSVRVKNTFTRHVTKKETALITVVAALIVVLGCGSLAMKRADFAKALTPKSERVAEFDYHYPALELKVDQRILPISEAQKASYDVRTHGYETFYFSKAPDMILDDYLEGARAAKMPYGENYLEMELNDAGAEAFAKLTGENVGERMAIIFNGEIMSVPYIREKIEDGKVQVTGGMYQSEVEAMASKLRFVIKNRQK